MIPTPAGTKPFSATSSRPVPVSIKNVHHHILPEPAFYTTGLPAVSPGSQRRVLGQLAANGRVTRDGNPRTTEAARVDGKVGRGLGGPALSVEISRKPRRAQARGLRTRGGRARAFCCVTSRRPASPPLARTHARSLARPLLLCPRAPFPTLPSSPGLRQPLSARCILGFEVEPVAVALRERKEAATGHRTPESPPPERSPLASRRL